ncbi:MULTISPECIES: hypothetical protein [Paenibacillus]|uniref:hypothetical protein n=1 Tax=Paenibacillus TaxID=44249 RepID=UPI001B133999|nr:hypothetical protein [Paenibacillus macerans]GIP13992.1 hypothetical protein J1TS5_61620 [Paenibacillus macerans]
MTITVYQQVFADRDKTRVHVTIVDGSGAVLDRRFCGYEPYPLKQIADEHARHLLRVIGCSLDAEKVIIDCNVRGRVEYTATPGGGFKGELVWHPRFGDVKGPRLQWAEPAPEEPEEDKEESEE